MSGDLIVGIDAGTSVIKAVAFTTTGEQVAMASRPNVYDTPGPGQVEQDMARTWSDTAATLRELGERLPGFASRIVALAVTAQGDGTWLIDRDGEPVGGGLLWLDSRAADTIAGYLKTDAYAHHYALTGSGLNACMASGQMAWMKRHQPERIANAAVAFHCKDWLYYKLTGERVTDPSEACFTFGNYRTRQYEPSILAGMGIADCERLLPPMKDGAEEGGRLSAAASSVTGLPQGLPVILGYLDTVCTALGGGLYDRDGGAGVSVFGSTGMHMRYAPDVDAVRLNGDRSGYTKAFPVPGSLAQMQSNMAATLNIDWLIDVGREAAAIVGAKASRADFLNGMDDRVLGAKPAAALYHPYIFEAGERGPFLDPNARAQFTGLSSRLGYADLMRSVYEGLALASRDCYLATGSIPAEVRVAGGAARSRAIRTILASALDVPVRTVSREETGAAGAAMMAAVNLGIFPDFAACCDTWVTPLLGEAISPDPGLAKLYGELYTVYRSVREQMAPAWAALAHVRQESLA